jgi:hypothetical protein
MQSKTQICAQGQVSLIMGLPQELTQVLQRLHEMNIPAFVTRYDCEASGEVVAANQQFFVTCGNNAGSFLGRTYRQIHSNDSVADEFTAAERKAIGAPKVFYRVPESDSVDVVKVALPAHELSGSPGGNSGTNFILGFFIVLSSGTKTTNLHPALAQAKQSIRESLPTLEFTEGAAGLAE